MSPVSITAYTLVNALGDDAEAVISALERGETGLGRNSFADRLTADVDTVCGAVSHLDPLPAALAAYDTRQARIAWMGIAGLVRATQKAATRWGSTRVGLVIGTSTGGIAATEAAWQRWHADGVWPADFDLARHH